MVVEVRLRDVRFVDPVLRDCVALPSVPTREGCHDPAMANALADVALLARELVEMQDRPLVAHPKYTGTGETADGDALALVQCNSYRAVECCSLSAVLERLELADAVRLAGLVTASANPNWLWSLPAELRPSSEAGFSRYVQAAQACLLRTVVLVQVP